MGRILTHETSVFELSGDVCSPRPRLIAKGCIRLECRSKGSRSRAGMQFVQMKDGLLSCLRKGTHRAGGGASHLAGEVNAPEPEPSSSPLPYRPDFAAYCRRDVGGIVMVL
jgi:hypothetical protein